VVMWVGGTVEEMSKWVEYITFDGESPMANLRRKTDGRNHGKLNSGAWGTKAGAAVAI